MIGAEYQLLSFVSHMGTSTQSGHYVVHVRKDDHWVIFNDSKVALSGDPPKDMGYLYFFQRLSSWSWAIFLPRNLQLCYSTESVGFEFVELSQKEQKAIGSKTWRDVGDFSNRK